MDRADGEWLAQVRNGHPPGPFGHREHLRLAWLALEATGAVGEADQLVSSAIRAIAATHGAPQKYNQTVTSAWVRIISHVRSAKAPRSFADMLDTAPWLFEKRLLMDHYSSSALASNAARNSYVEPDLRPIPA